MPLLIQAVHQKNFLKTLIFRFLFSLKNSRIVNPFFSATNSSLFLLHSFFYLIRSLEFMSNSTIEAKIKLLNCFPIACWKKFFFSFSWAKREKFTMQKMWILFLASCAAPRQRNRITKKKIYLFLVLDKKNLHAKCDRIWIKWTFSRIWREWRT